MSASNLKILNKFLYTKGYNDIDEEKELRNYVSSLNIVEMICFIEDSMNILIPDEDTYIFSEDLVTISRYLDKYNSGKNKS